MMGRQNNDQGPLFYEFCLDEAVLEGLFIDRMEGNEEIFDRIMQDETFRDVATAHLVREVYERLKEREKTN
jgi:type I restriction enzyme, R subunit